MTITINSWKPIDFAILGITGATLLITIFGAWYTIPWRRRSRRAESTKEFNVFWQGRTTLELFSALWVGSQLLRLSGIWGKNSFIFPSLVTEWTGAGWFCRVYLTASLGLFQPFCSFLTLWMFATAVSRKPPPQRAEHSSGTKHRSRKGYPNSRLFVLTMVATLPFLAAQAVIAWLSLVLKSNGHRPEKQPRSTLGYFFATYWYGDVRQCDGEEGCTLCVFPAAAVIVQIVFSIAYLVSLWVTSSRMAAAVVNKHLERRLRIFWIADSLLVVAGAAALGGSIIKGPFSWVNQGCWIGYFLTVVATIILVSWEVVIWPVYDLSKVNKRLKQWTDPSEGLLEPEGEGYIKAASVRGSRLLEAQAGSSSSAAASSDKQALPPMASVPPSSLLV